MATAVSQSRHDYRVKASSTQTADSKQLHVDEVQTSFSSSHSLPAKITLACGVDITFTPSAQGGEGTCAENSTGQQHTSIQQSWSSRFTEGASSTGDFKNPSQNDPAKGAAMLLKKDAWTAEELKDLNPAQCVSSFEDLCYNKSSKSATFLGGKSVCVTNNSAVPCRQSMVHFSSGAGSGGTGSRSGQLYSAVGQTDFGNGAGTNCSTQFVSCDSSSSASPSRPLVNSNVGCGCGSTSSSFNNTIIGPNNMLEMFQFLPLTNPTSIVSSTAYYSSLDGVERLRVQPLRFKMLPSPVPYEMLFADNLTKPPPERLAHYQMVMLRWYKHILVAQENTRVRIRQRCPPPPEDVLQQINPPAPEQLQRWSAQCCRWWDESSRRRTRRGHRGGKTSAGAATTRGTQSQRPHSTTRTKSPGDVREFTAPSCTLLCDLSSHTNFSPDEENNFNWNHLIETIIGADE